MGQQGTIITTKWTDRRWPPQSDTGVAKSSRWFAFFSVGDVRVAPSVLPNLCCSSFVVLFFCIFTY